MTELTIVLSEKYKYMCNATNIKSIGNNTFIKSNLIVPNLGLYNTAYINKNITISGNIYTDIYISNSITLNNSFVDNIYSKNIEVSNIINKDIYTSNIYCNKFITDIGTYTGADLYTTNIVTNVLNIDTISSTILNINNDIRISCNTCIIKGVVNNIVYNNVNISDNIVNINYDAKTQFGNDTGNNSGIEIKSINSSGYIKTSDDLSHVLIKYPNIDTVNKIIVFDEYNNFYNAGDVNIHTDLFSYSDMKSDIINIIGYTTLLTNLNCYSTLTNVELISTNNILTTDFESNILLSTNFIVANTSEINNITVLNNLYSKNDTYNELYVKANINLQNNLDVDNNFTSTSTIYVNKSFNLSSNIISTNIMSDTCIVNNITILSCICKKSIHTNLITTNINSNVICTNNITHYSVTNNNYTHFIGNIVLLNISEYSDNIVAISQSGAIGSLYRIGEILNILI